MPLAERGRPDDAMQAGQDRIVHRLLRIESKRSAGIIGRTRAIRAAMEKDMRSLQLLQPMRPDPGIQQNHTSLQVFLENREGSIMNHADLVKIAAKWLKSIGCSVVLSELVTCAGEIPDAIGWKSGCSILIECKVSRADFIKGQKKIFRQRPEMGMGMTRLYLCPENVIQPEDLPEKWGLLWVGRKGKVQRVKCFKGNIIDREYWFNKVNHKNEVAMLCSYIRRKEACQKNGN